MKWFLRILFWFLVAFNTFTGMIFYKLTYPLIALFFGLLIRKLLDMRREERYARRTE